MPSILRKNVHHLLSPRYGDVMFQIYASPLSLLPVGLDVVDITSVGGRWYFWYPCYPC